MPRKPPKRKPKARPAEKPASASPAGSNAGWYTRRELAAILDVTETQVDRLYRKYVPADGQKKDGGRWLFHARKMLDGWMAAELSRKSGPDPGDDPMLTGAAADSPALEEYRRHKARIAKVDADLKEQSAIPLDDLRPALTAGAGIIRSAGERLEREHGHEAAGILIEAVDELEGVWRRMLGQPGDGAAAVVAAADAAGAAADDARVR